MARRPPFQTTNVSEMPPEAKPIAPPVPSGWGSIAYSEAIAKVVADAGSGR